MKKNLLTVGLLAVTISANAQGILTHIDNTAVFYVGEGSLVYNGGGLQTKGSGMMDVHGNVMVVGTAGTDKLYTLDANGAQRTAAADNIVLRLNNPATYQTSTYGQLFINGLNQGDIKGFVKKEYLAKPHGASTGMYFQQIAMPFYGKVIGSLSTELGKAFTQQRWTQKEILKWDNTNVVSHHYQWLGHITTDPTGYYMLSSRYNDLNMSAPPASLPTVAPTPLGSVFTIAGVPFASGTTATTAASLTGAGASVQFGPSGNATNIYNELYNTYITDPFEAAGTAWTNSWGKNTYQFGNPYLTNLDLKYIGYNESTSNDGNALTTKIWGVSYDPGTVVTLSNGSTLATGALVQTYDLSTGVAAGDVGLIIKPLQAFKLKMRDNTAQTLNFDNLRRFGMGSRKIVSGTTAVNYDVTAERSINNTKKTKTLKQLGVIALNSNNEEIGRTYYVVSPRATSGHIANPAASSLQVTSKNGYKIGTFEEDPVNGMYDPAYQSQYWLYINEANENNFRGKPIPMAIYDTQIAKLKFEVRENAELIPDGKHELSSDIGFYYKASNGLLQQVRQGEEVQVTSNQYGLYYGAPASTGFEYTYRGAEGEVSVPSRTMVVYNGAIDNYVVQFDPSWKAANVKVYDMSGKLVIAKENVKTDSDFVIELNKKIKTTYLVNVVSSEGKETNAKIIR